MDGGKSVVSGSHSHLKDSGKRTDTSFLWTSASERRPLLDSTHTVERTGDASHHTGYSALSNEALPGSTDTVTGAEDASSPYCVTMVKAFLKCMSELPCRRQLSPAQDAPPQDASAVPESDVGEQPSNSAIMRLGAGKKPPERRVTIPISGQGSDKRIPERASTIEGRTSTTRGDLGFSEQRSWDHLDGRLRLAMKEICRRIPDICYCVTTFSILSNRLHDSISGIKYELDREHNKNLSKEEKEIKDAILDIQFKISNKKDEMAEDHDYQFLKDQGKKLGNLQFDFKQAEERLGKMTEPVPTLKGSSRDGREASSFGRYPLGRSSRDLQRPASSQTSARLEQMRKDLERKVNTLPQDIEKLQKEISSLEGEIKLKSIQIEYDKLVDEHEQLKLGLDKFRIAFDAEVEQVFSQKDDIQSLRRQRDKAKENMLRLAEDLKKEIKSENEELYNEYLTHRLDTLSNKLAKGVKQVGVEFQMRNPPDMSQEQDMAAFYVGEFIAFADALKGLKDNGGSFEDTDKQRLRKALDSAANRLKEAQPLQAKKTLEIVQKIWQAKEPLSQAEKNTIETILIRTRQGDTLSREEKDTLMRAREICREKPLSPDGKEALGDMLMRSLKEEQPDDGHSRFAPP